MLLSFSIGTFLTNYDVTKRKLYIVQKQTICKPNKSMETTLSGSNLGRQLALLYAIVPWQLNELVVTNL